ncbi:hypothetical protein BCR33DRAFT_720817 [Rhizoclosmatium globosum]|uniref:Uncharacterized protein n=1 Tax=Rhizoclosmatium globosum TaxID=329046 RepID=A0A1Y2BUU7_9FUNG|nr:hypothetical protein BCR33DRAFT_720817 [Rhizoclosmatium globosum]|eukprot:ORY38444.1 hypothetical protein BCR33DRAFT_720817 [Rhizoclosmatium globosum]
MGGAALLGVIGEVTKAGAGVASTAITTAGETRQTEIKSQAATDQARIAAQGQRDVAASNATAKMHVADTALVGLTETLRSKERIAEKKAETERQKAQLEAEMNNNELVVQQNEAVLSAFSAVSSDGSTLLTAIVQGVSRVNEVGIAALGKMAEGDALTVNKALDLYGQFLKYAEPLLSQNVIPEWRVKLAIGFMDGLMSECREIVKNVQDRQTADRVVLTRLIHKGMTALDRIKSAGIGMTKALTENVVEGMAVSAAAPANAAAITA